MQAKIIFGLDPDKRSLHSHLAKKGFEKPEKKEPGNEIPQDKENLKEEKLPKKDE